MFRVGQRVRLKSGTSWQVVQEVLDRDNVQYLRTQYLSALRYGESYPTKPRVASDYEGEKEEMSILYQTKDGKFGTRIATNSQGKIVLEMKGSGEVAAFDEGEIAEVVPFTAKFRVPGERESHSFQVPEGRLEVGDLVIVQGELLEVTRLDTKDRTAKKPSGMRLVPTERLW